MRYCARRRRGRNDHTHVPILAAVLSKRDGELACDEGTVARRQMQRGRTTSSPADISHYDQYHSQLYGPDDS